MNENSLSFFWFSFALTLQRQFLQSRPIFDHRNGRIGLPHPFSPVRILARTDSILLKFAEHSHAHTFNTLYYRAHSLSIDGCHSLVLLLPMNRATEVCLQVTMAHILIYSNGTRSLYRNIKCRLFNEMKWEKSVCSHFSYFLCLVCFFFFVHLRLRSSMWCTR